MSTIFANLSTTAISTSNNVKVALYKESDPLAEVTSQTFANIAGVVPERQWSFPGLDRTNYICKVLEVDGSDNILQQYNRFEFVPNENETEWKDPILIQIGATAIPGGSGAFPAGVNTVTVPDWKNWDIQAERIGAGTMKKTIDYTWNEATGVWTLLAVGDVFVDGEYFFVTFAPRVNIGGGVNNASGALFSQRKLVTNSLTLTASDIGKKILVQGAVSYLEITLPDITTVVENKITFFEFGRGTLKCARLKTATGQIIDWLQGTRASLYGCPNETLELYKVVNLDTSQAWRVNNSDGNFKSVGQHVNEMITSGGVFNKVLLDGTAISSNDYARLYNDYVLRLPSSSVCNYADWGTGNNKYKYSFKDSGTGLFHVPDLRDKYERMVSASNLAAAYQANTVGPHYHISGIYEDSSDYADGSASPNNIGVHATVTPVVTSAPTNSSGSLLGGTESRPETIVVNKYVLV
jgi:hypothetical protein